MYSPDDTLPESQPSQPIEPIAEMAAVPATAEAAPVADVPVEPAASVEVVETAEVAPETPPVAHPKPKRVPKPSVSDDTLAAYQASLAADRAERQHKQRQAQAANERAEAFKQVRAMLRELEQGPAEAVEDPLIAALRDDRLAMAVHDAPAHTRAVIEATLSLMSGAKRRGRPAKR